jgi:sugar (pentulose or hexulose) kinase
VLCGIHDSNASLLRYLASRSEDEPFTVISTGTWVIVAAVGASLEALDPRRDMLANVDVRGRPIPCARFMGGREFETLNDLRGESCTDADVGDVIARRTFALPAFAAAGGPFPGRQGHIVGGAPGSAATRYALATLYCALVTDHCLTALRGRGDIIIEGSFTANRHYAALLAALRPRERVWLSDDGSGTVGGAFVLANWGRATPAPTLTPVAPFDRADVLGYRDEWAVRCVA